MLFPLTRWEIRKWPKPSLRSLVNLASAELLSVTPRVRGLLMRTALFVNKVTVDVVAHLQVAETFETMKIEAASSIEKRQEKVTPSRVAEEVDAMLTPPTVVPVQEQNFLH